MNLLAEKGVSLFGGLMEFHQLHEKYEISLGSSPEKATKNRKTPFHTSTWLLATGYWIFNVF